MKYLEQRESRVHGTFDFPFGYYNITSEHPRYIMVDHWHPEYEIIRINKGTFPFKVNGHQYVGQPGDFFIVQDGALHGGIPQRCHYECIVFNLHTIAELNPLCVQLIQPVLFGGSQFPEYISQPNARLKQAGDALFSSFAMDSENSPYFTIGAIFTFIGALLDGYTERRTQKPQEAELRRLARIKDVLRLIRNHYHEEITLDDMATSAHMNKHYFCRYFREMMGKTPIQYLNYYRVECACELLSTSERTVSEVAMACGFNNISYFTRVFGTHRGITPSLFAKRSRLS
ncbi:MAG: helix-turn-helix transcriptional regulator [Clostridiales bacterium]|nr:helix-turn-helix transcriptional regulator [Clostridiales bacterium]